MMGVEDKKSDRRRLPAAIPKLSFKQGTIVEAHYQLVSNTDQWHIVNLQFMLRKVGNSVRIVVINLDTASSYFIATAGLG